MQTQGVGSLETEETDRMEIKGNLQGSVGPIGCRGGALQRRVFCESASCWHICLDCLREFSDPPNDAGAVTLLSLQVSEPRLLGLGRLPLMASLGGGEARRPDLGLSTHCWCHCYCIGVGPRLVLSALGRVVG